MGQILIRKIDDTTIARLRLLAKERKMPVEALARQALEEAAARQSADERLDILRKLDALRASSPRSDFDSTILVRALRDGDDSDD